MQRTVKIHQPLPDRLQSLTTQFQEYGGFLKSGVPPNHPYFLGWFSIINHPAIGVPLAEPLPFCAAPWVSSGHLWNHCGKSGPILWILSSLEDVQMLHFVANWQETLKLPSTCRLIATNAMHPPSVSRKKHVYSIANAAQTRMIAPNFHVELGTTKNIILYQVLDMPRLWTKQLHILEGIRAKLTHKIQISWCPLAWFLWL
jgi:hypothetical protein